MFASSQLILLNDKRGPAFAVSVLDVFEPVSGLICRIP